MKAIESTFQFLQEKQLITPRSRLVDLGAGDGRIILFASEQYKIQSLDLEINEVLIQTTSFKIQQKNVGNLCRIEEADFYNYDLASFDIIFTFLVPTNHSHFTHVIEILKSGAVVVGSKWPLTTFQTYWKKSYHLTPFKEYSIYIYIKK